MQARTPIDRMLAANGLGPLNDAGTIPALACLVRDHAHFRSLLAACEPQLRRDMYQAMSPHLCFAAKPLDVYISEAGAVAEAKQLPTITEDGGLRPFRSAELRTVEDAVNRTLASEHLVLTCRKCTKQATFHGVRKADAIQQAREAGWTYGLDAKGEGREICPDCPGGAKPDNRFRARCGKCGELFDASRHQNCPDCEGLKGRAN